jgi:hypothetical protein
MVVCTPQRVILLPSGHPLLTKLREHRAARWQPFPDTEQPAAGPSAGADLTGSASAGAEDMQRTAWPHGTGAGLDGHGSQATQPSLPEGLQTGHRSRRGRKPTSLHPEPAAVVPAAAAIAAGIQTGLRKRPAASHAAGVDETMLQGAEQGQAVGRRAARKRRRLDHTDAPPVRLAVSVALPTGQRAVEASCAAAPGAHNDTAMQGDEPPSDAGAGKPRHGARAVHNRGGAAELRRTATPQAAVDAEPRVPTGEAGVREAGQPAVPADGHGNGGTTGGPLLQPPQGQQVPGEKPSAAQQRLPAVPLTWDDLDWSVRKANRALGYEKKKAPTGWVQLSQE